LKYVNWIFRILPGGLIRLLRAWAVWWETITYGS
jgi:hypothetical protein